MTLYFKSFYRDLTHQWTEKIQLLHKASVQERQMSDTGIMEAM